jgi:hypothetical protein
MKTLICGGAAIALGLGTPALACSPRFTPFSQVVDEADFAFHARADVRMKLVSDAAEEGSEEEIYEGEVRFSRIECYAAPRGERHCPRSLTVPFTAVEDGHNCPSWVMGATDRYRYFTLWRGEEGEWELGGAWRSFEGRR